MDDTSVSKMSLYEDELVMQIAAQIFCALRRNKNNHEECVTESITIAKMIINEVRGKND
jgi:hypothetical protein